MLGDVSGDLRFLLPEENERIRGIIRDRLFAARGYNQSTLAPLLGMTQATLSGFLGGRQGTSPTIARRVEQLADESGATPSTPIGRAKNAEDKRATVEAVLAAWLRFPELRLGQLLVSASNNVFHIEDRDLVDRLARFADEHAKPAKARRAGCKGKPPTPPDDTSTFARRVRFAMAQRSITITGLDARLEKGSGFTSRVLSQERRQPRANTVAAIAQALSVSAQWLITGEDA